MVNNVITKEVARPPPVVGWFLAGLIFYHEDGSDTFLRNDGLHMDYTALYPRIWKLS
jgi:hypothetical protein